MCQVGCETQLYHTHLVANRQLLQKESISAVTCLFFIWGIIVTELVSPCMYVIFSSCITTLTAVGLFSCRPHSLELSPGFYLGPDHQWRLF